MLRKLPPWLFQRARGCYRYSQPQTRVKGFSVALSRGSDSVLPQAVSDYVLSFCHEGEWN